MSSASGGSGRSPLRVAFAGNSFIYYNDLPRVFEAFFAPGDVVTTSCLRGGATITSLCELGNGMGKKFATANGLLPDGSYDVGVWHPENAAVPTLFVARSTSLSWARRPARKPARGSRRCLPRPRVAAPSRNRLRVL